MSKWMFVAGCSLLPVFGFGQSKPPSSNNWWIREFLDRLDFTGTRTLGYQNYKFEGDPDAFASLTNYGTGLQHFTDIGNLSVTGNKVFGILDFRATFTDNRFSDPEQQQYTFNYKKGFYDLSYGTVQASLLNSNRFANFSRSLNGFVGGFKQGRLESKVIASSARGATRTVTIEGNNSAGPYYLQSGRIIGGSIKVLLDGIELQQGVDYLVDTAVGSITFTNRVIPPTSSVVASYESYDVNGGGGSIRGAGLTYDLGGGAGRIGVSTQEQLVGTASTTSERVEAFQGFGFPLAEYPINYTPIPASITVTVDGILRTFSVVDDGVSEFYLKSGNSSIVISRFAIPSSQTIFIRYIPQAVQAVNGNRKVVGFDWRVPLGTKASGSSITYSKANGKMEGGTSGNADAVDLRLNEGKGTFKMGLRKVDPGFQTIEQTGFNRNEDVAEYGFDYYTKGVNSTFGTSNSLISSTSGSVTSFNRLTTNTLNVRYADPNRRNSDSSKTQSLSISQSRLRSTDNSSLNTISYEESYRRKRFNFGYTVSNQTGRGRVDGTMTGIGVNVYKSSVSYGLGNNWSLVGSASKSYVKTDTRNSDGYDYALRANMAQTGPWMGGIEYATSDSGLLASLNGFLNGSTFGYGAGGFGGSGGTGVISTGQTKLVRTAFNATHQAGDNLTMGLTYSSNKTQGNSTSNAKIDTIGLNVGWRINDFNNFQFDVMDVKSNYLTSLSGNSTSRVYSGFLVGTPGKFWSYNLGFSLMKTQGSSSDQDNLALQSNVSYRMNDRSRFFGTGSISRTRGLFPQNDLDMQAGYAYSIYSGIDLVGKYSFRRLENLDPSAVGGAFRANGFSLELTFNLSNRH